MIKTLLLLVSLVMAPLLASDDVAELRAGGQRSVDALHARLAEPGVAELLDRVCAQKDCAESRLYWYTDMEQAQAAARQLGRPIVTLHLLGRLDEELSCANSRFFRTILYSDESIASLLRDEFVLHWHSVRPVPRITIEFGDGRRIQQTITGNSVHYLLAEDGAVLDALPGLYSPAAFRRQLEAWIALHRAVAGKNDSARRHHLADYHKERSSIAKTEWAALSRRTGILPDIRTVRTLKRPTAAEAAVRATSKVAIEGPLVTALDLNSPRWLAATQWVELGRLEQENVVFSPATIALIRRKHLGSQPSLTDMNEVLDNLRRTVAADSILNEYALHVSIHDWFATMRVGDLRSLDARIYAELFLTPGDDPWLGLKPASVFTAIAN
jgi:hypothetical protein